MMILLETDLFLTEEREEIVKFLCGKRVEGAGAGADEDVGEVRGRRLPATLATSATTNHHLYITEPDTNATRPTVTLASCRLFRDAVHSIPTTFTFVLSSATSTPHYEATMKAKAFTAILPLA
ncbi:unnamed protein product, partial [Brenthis ino]